VAALTKNPALALFVSTLQKLKPDVGEQAGAVEEEEEEEEEVGVSGGDRASKGECTGACS